MFWIEFNGFVAVINSFSEFLFSKVRHSSIRIQVGCEFTALWCFFATWWHTRQTLPVKYPRTSNISLFKPASRLGR